jgi:hypothetical protein
VVTERKQASPSESNAQPGARCWLAHLARASEVNPETGVILV